MSTFEWLSILLSVMGSTWYLALLIHRCMPKDECEKKRRNCFCRMELRKIKHHLDAESPGWRIQKEPPSPDETTSTS